MDADSDTEKKIISTKKRDIKVQEKSDKPIRKMKSVDASSRIGKLVSHLN